MEIDNVKLLLPQKGAVKRTPNSTSNDLCNYMESDYLFFKTGGYTKTSTEKVFFVTCRTMMIF